jgi:NAD+ diphosphatase
MAGPLAPGLKKPLHIGLLDKVPCWLFELDESQTQEPSGCNWSEIRPSISLLDAEEWRAVACSLTLLWWRKNHRFCGSCGTETVEGTEERVLCCPNCGALFYPNQSPAVIVAVTKDDALLLAHNSHFHPEMHSILAGFVDPGETIEETVARELREEVGIEVKNIRYARSQPWPFPNSLMIGFHAEWQSGELKPDGVEIKFADWFTRDNLPALPRPGSIARMLIDEWADKR